MLNDASKINKIRVCGGSFLGGAVIDALIQIENKTILTKNFFITPKIYSHLIVNDYVSSNPEKLIPIK
jgi:hypothetical protein